MLGSGCSIVTFNRICGTCVVAARPPRTRSLKRTVLLAVVATSVAAF